MASMVKLQNIHQLDDGQTNPAFAMELPGSGGEEKNSYVLRIENDAADKNIREDKKPIIDWQNEDFEDIEYTNESKFAIAIGHIQDGFVAAYTKCRRIIIVLIALALAAAYIAYFAYCMYCRFGDEGSRRLLVITAIALFCVLYYFFKRYVVKPYVNFKCHIPSRASAIIYWVIVLVIAALIIFYVVYDIAIKDPHNLVSAAGMFGLLLFCFLTSHNPKRIIWRPVYTGCMLQFIFAILILRTKPGKDAFQFVGDRVTEFIEHTTEGVIFVFGVKYYEHFVAFKVLSIIVFFSSFISILYYLGVMQILIQKIAWVMQVTMGTSAGESLNATANIFLGMTEAPLAIRPILHRMTNSELHAVFTGGFATVAGSVLGSYIAFGVPASHLLSASVMSAPAALAISKLYYPETKKSMTTAKHVKSLEKSPHKGLVEAACAGATGAIRICGSVAVNLIAFVALLHFVNATLTWFGARACMERDLTFQLIMSYVLWPLAVIMGVHVDDCRTVAELIGDKIFLNEFIAYERFGKYVKNRKILDGSTNWEWRGDDIFDLRTNNTLIGGILSERSEIITTFALCGFSNFGSVAIMCGAFQTFIPNRTKDIMKIATRAMIAGNVACFMTACIAGLFFETNI